MFALCGITIFAATSLILLQAVIKTGSYIDIGSGHPVKGNNTYFLYQRGWTGILIDPILLNSELSKKHRLKDLFLNRIVSNLEGSLMFWEFLSYGLSTTNVTRATFLLGQTNP